MSTQNPSSRIWIGGGAAVAVLVMLASWFILISPVRADASALRDDTGGVETQNAALVADVADLRALAETRNVLERDLRTALGGLPVTVSLPDFNKQVLAQAAGRRVEITNISVAPATTVGADTAAAPVEEAVPGATPGTAAPAPDPVPATGALVVPVTIQSKGPALAQLYFLRDIQQLGPRRALVRSTALTAGEDADTADLSTLTIQLSIFAAALSDADRSQLAEVLGDDLVG